MGNKDKRTHKKWSDAAFVFARHLHMNLRNVQLGNQFSSPTLCPASGLLCATACKESGQGAARDRENMEDTLAYT